MIALLLALALLAPPGVHYQGTVGTGAVQWTPSVTFAIDSGYPIAGGQDAGTGTAVNVTTTATTGTMIAVAFSWENDASQVLNPATVSGAGLTWTKQVEVVATGAFPGHSIQAVWTAPRGSVDMTGQTVTVTRTGTTTNNTVAISVYSFTGASTTVGNVGSYYNDASTTVAATVTTTVGSFVVGAWGWGGGVTEFNLATNVVRDRTGSNTPATSRVNSGRIPAATTSTVIGSTDARTYGGCVGLEIKTGV
jgi:hypothetical protein